jgi:predicted nucleic acid-binding protein
MKLDEFESGMIYIDVNIFYMYLRTDEAHRTTLLNFFRKVIAGKIQAYTSVLVMDELFYRLLLGLIKDAHGSNPLDVLRQQRTELITTHAPIIENALRKLIRLPNLHLVGIEGDNFYQMLDNINDYAIMPRDALHFAVMQRLELLDIASDDTDFDRLPEITRHWVINPPNGLHR